MNVASMPIEPAVPAQVDLLPEALERGCATFAPTWPLDQLIAVNPWWGMRHLPMHEVTARLAALGRARGLMPGGYYATSPGALNPEHLQRAAADLGVTAGVEQLRAHLAAPEPQRSWHNISELVDGVTRGDGRVVLWADEIVHQVSQFCAATFQLDNLLQPAALSPGDLYRRWLAATRADRGIAVLMGEPDLAGRLAALPDDHQRLLAEAVDALGVGAAAAADYAQALLLDLNGWASWVAYLRWQDALDGSDNGFMSELLAIRMAWELVLWRQLEHGDPARFAQVRSLWRRQLGSVEALLSAHRQHQRATWVWQRAAELAYQDAVHRALRRPASPVAHPEVRLQAVFCIDVRSEVMRRALEAQDPGIVTLGFAGFFGLPIEYRPAGTAFARPQLPGLLKPSICAVEADCGGEFAAARARESWSGVHLSRLAEAPPATFSLVEATGLAYAFALLKETLLPGERRHPVDSLHQGSGWRLERDGTPLATAELAELVAGILGAMGLTRGFAPTVLLVGHGSTSRNNPHAAGLDCGACGGQTGEVNVRVLAGLLNDPAVRSGLRDLGVDVPEATRFVGALHDTTTDEIRCFEAGQVEPCLPRWLAGAGVRARRERAGRLGLHGLDDRALEAACRRRARDWSQVRPEWGLAGNASFIVAPRERTRHLDLAGRTFLHDYRWRDDDRFQVLELIMTAPMLVTHWINLQYFASTTDNRKYGSGNKVLHNVVGGNLGVFEGNGGDLRIGLPLQSLHDGERWMHEPLRLSVYLAAPRQAIAEIAARHLVVAELIDNEWLFLFRLDDDGATIERFRCGGWTAVVAEVTAVAGEASAVGGEVSA